MSLTNARIAKAKPSTKPYTLPDAFGLALKIEPSGAKRWRMNYRYSGRQKTLYIGSWLDISLSDARTRCIEAKALLADGRDPAHLVRQERIAKQLAASSSFRAVAEEWYAKSAREGRAQATLSKIRWLLEMAYPTLGANSVGNITAQEVLLVLQRAKCDEMKGDFRAISGLAACSGGAQQS